MLNYRSARLSRGAQPKEEQWKLIHTNTTTAPALSPGFARLAGTVVGPNGPVANATVAFERLVDDAVVTGIISTGADTELHVEPQGLRP